MAYELNGMSNAIDIKSLQSITIESLTQITFKVGTNSIVMTPAGITIKCGNLSMEAMLEMKLNSLIMKEQVMIKESNIDMVQLN